MRPGSQHTYPKVNIIGCLHPIELILAKADDRLRKQNSTNEQKRQLCNDKSNEITKKINSETHHEVNFQLKQQQFAWVKISQTAIYISKLYIVFTEFRSHLHRINIVFISSRKIQNMMQRWFTRHKFRKYRLSIFKMLGSNAFIFKMTLRIYLKRRAVMKVITFLKEQESNSKVGKVVRKFLYSVRRIQQFVRKFLAVRRASLLMISKKWVRLETHYLFKLMDGKVKRFNQMERSHGGSQATALEGGKTTVKHNNKKYQLADSINFSELITESQKVKMKTQSYKWSKINSKMEEKISQLKVDGVIEVVTREDIIARLMITVEERENILRNLIRHMRHRYNANQRSIEQVFYERSLVFSEKDALNLLKGADSAVNTSINFIMKQRLNNRPNVTKSKTFPLFSELSNKVLMRSIVEAQDNNESLQLKVEFEQPLWDKLKHHHRG